MAFARNPAFRCLPVIDERSAGFIALGIAQQSQQPVVLLCTSGSAVTNFYPAVVEAYYQHIPLVLITADRPPELIDQWDGQTIRQQNLFGSHVKGSFCTPDVYEDKEMFSNVTAAALALATAGSKGPVHINVPLREPLYPQPGKNIPVVTLPAPAGIPNVQKKLPAVHLNKHDRVLIIHGAQPFAADYHPANYRNAVVISDVVSNQHAFQSFHNWENVLMIRDSALQEKLRPDVLITTGTSVVSKNLKLFLRKYQPKVHYHFSGSENIADPFQTQPILIPQELPAWLAENPLEGNKDYFDTWQKAAQQAAISTAAFFTGGDLNEFRAAQSILTHLPANTRLQLANSMTVRYANLVGLGKDVLSSNCNRGTSGIDGCVSTAVGAALHHPDDLTVLLTGDIAFFYDSNALWNKHVPENLRIFVLNNAGGGIFRLIDGPREQPELEDFFETTHSRTAALLAANLGIVYVAIRNAAEMHAALETIYQPKGPVIAEIFTDRYENETFFNQYKQTINGINSSMGNHKSI